MQSANAPKRGSRESRDLQRRMNGQTLQVLRERGSDLAKAHAIQNVFWVYDKADLAVLLKHLVELEYEITDPGRESSEDGTKYWGVEAQTVIIPGHSRIDEMTDACVDATENIDADYDGWGTEVVD